jgi:LPXTG-site transpeptidase (sortase) family protein
VGAVVISAHVDSIDSGVGPFASLRRAKPGDKVTVTVGGESRVYAVERAFRVAKGDLDTAALFARDGAPRLHLVTCGGQFDPASGHYDDNIVVVATAL